MAKNQKSDRNEGEYSNDQMSQNIKFANQKK